MLADTKDNLWSSMAIASLTATFGFASGCIAEQNEIADNLPPTFEEFEAGVYQEPWEDGVYIVNGDTPVATREQLREFYEQLAYGGELIINTLAGDTQDRWDETAKWNITYCVSQSSFGDNYSRVVTAMERAMGTWEGAADVGFVHLSELDGACDARTPGVVFDVRQVQSGQYLARAFFPSTSRRQRNVLIDTSTYVYDDDNSDPLSLEGVLRHELGHTLGFRHEHTRPESGVCFEDNNWSALTPYDSGSVMHYPQCNGTGNWSLTLTNDDKAGAASAYNTGAGGGACFPAGDSCSANADCCSNSCREGVKTCE